MKFYDDANLTRAGKNDEIIIVIRREDARAIGEILESYADTNKRSKKARALSQSWDEKCPCMV